MKIQNFTAIGLFLVALHLKCSALGIGPKITWFEVFLPILFLWLWEAISFILDLFKITQKIEIFYTKKLLALYVWQRAREAEALQKKIYKKAKK